MDWLGGIGRKRGQESLLWFLWEGRSEAQYAGLGLARLKIFQWALEHRGCPELSGIQSWCDQGR